MTFKVGDKVRINPKSQYYGNYPTEQLPPNVIGTIYSLSCVTRDVHWIFNNQVYINSYWDKDLIKVKSINIKDFNEEF